jgi:hypothetical protein
MIVDAPWYVPNTVIRRDLQIPTVKEEIPLQLQMANKMGLKKKYIWFLLTYNSRHKYKCICSCANNQKHLTIISLITGNVSPITYNTIFVANNGPTPLPAKNCYHLLACYRFSLCNLGRRHKKIPLPIASVLLRVEPLLSNRVRGDGDVAITVACKTPRFQLLRYYLLPWKHV